MTQYLVGPRYLLDCNAIRPLARLLRGDPAEVIEVAKSLRFKQQYTGGVLSLLEANISEELKIQLMDSFEKMLFGGLDSSRICGYWVEHRDKGRLELNYCFAHVDLATGKELTPYFDRADRSRVNAWLDVINITHNFADPKDPSRKQAVKIPRNLPKGRRQTIELIGECVEDGLKNGTIEYRRDVIKLIKKLGYSIVGETYSSISIRPKNSDLDTKPVRLRGGYFQQDFDNSSGAAARAEANLREFKSTANQRLAVAQSNLERLMRIKRDRYITRYGAVGESEPRGTQSSRANSHELSGSGCGAERSERAAEHSDRAAHTIDIEPKCQSNGRSEKSAEANAVIPDQSHRSTARDNGRNNHQIEVNPFELPDPFRAAAYASSARAAASARAVLDRLRETERRNSAAAMERDQERSRVKINARTSYPFVAVIGRIRDTVAAISTFVKQARSKIDRYIKRAVEVEAAQALKERAMAQEVINARIRPVLERLLQLVERKLEGDAALSSPRGRAWGVMTSDRAMINPELTRLREQFLKFFEIEREIKRSIFHPNDELETKKQNAILEFFIEHADPQKLESFSQSLMHVEVSAEVYQLPVIKNNQPDTTRSHEPRNSSNNDNDFGF